MNAFDFYRLGRETMSQYLSCRESQRPQHAVQLCEQDMAVKPAVLTQHMQMHINVCIHVNYAMLTAAPGSLNW